MDAIKEIKSNAVITTTHAESPSNNEELDAKFISLETQLTKIKESLEVQTVKFEATQAEYCEHKTKLESDLQIICEQQNQKLKDEEKDSAAE